MGPFPVPPSCRRAVGRWEMLALSTIATIK